MPIENIILLPPTIILVSKSMIKTKRTAPIEANRTFNLAFYPSPPVASPENAKTIIPAVANMTPAAESIGATLLKSSTPSIFGK